MVRACIPRLLVFLLPARALSFPRTTQKQKQTLSIVPIGTVGWGKRDGWESQLPLSPRVLSEVIAVWSTPIIFAFLSLILSAVLFSYSFLVPSISAVSVVSLFRQLTKDAIHYGFASVRCLFTYEACKPRDAVTVTDEEGASPVARGSHQVDFVATCRSSRICHSFTRIGVVLLIPTNPPLLSQVNKSVEHC